MSELLIPADAELAVIAELRSHHPGVHFGTRIPSGDTLPSRFVRVVGTGGTSVGLVVDESVLVVEVFALTEGEAYQLAARCVAVLERAARDGDVGGATCHVLTAQVPANNPHPNVPTHYRYTSTVAAQLRSIVE